MKRVLFLVHGMGTHAGDILGAANPASWTDQVAALLRKSARAFAQVDLDQLVLVPVLYDDVFHSYMKRWGDLAEALVGTPLQSLTAFMKSAPDPDFLAGSIGDVVLYRGFAQVRDHVLTHVARQIAEQIEAHGPADAEYSVLAHSLGTAVAHDAIQKLATTGIDGNTVLRPPNFRFANFFALANVSRLVWATDDAFYADTRVRPPDCGLDANDCAVHHYASFRHVADPIASIVRFDRPGWSQARFWSRPLRHVREANVHGFTHHLSHPLVTNLLFYRLFGSDLVTAAEMAQRLLEFEPYAAGALGEAQLAAVSAMESLLDGLSASAGDSFAHSIEAAGAAAIAAKQRGLL